MSARAWWIGAGEVGRTALGHWLIERRCAGCEVEIERGWLCGECDVAVRMVGPACPRCAMAIGPNVRAEPKGCAECRGHSIGFDGAVALGGYEGPLRALCLKLKRPRGLVVARRAVELMGEVRGEAIAGLGAEVVVPVPLFWWRRWRRGYNQAEALASRLAVTLGMEYTPVLRRIRSTRKLARLSPSARAKELRDSMVLSRGAERRLEGRVVLLVDDILTTGATCGEAARVLKRGGARRVVVAVLGRALRA